MWYLWIHPIIQTTATLTGLYALWLGWTRFRAAFLGRKGLFQWKRHVLAGKIAVIAWAVGLGLGLAFTRKAWLTLFITGAHYKIGLAMVPFLIFAYATGRTMDAHKQKRRAMPLAHAVNGLILACLAVAQLVTGLMILRDYVIP